MNGTGKDRPGTEKLDSVENKPYRMAYNTSRLTLVAATSQKHRNRCDLISHRIYGSAAPFPISPRRNWELSGVESPVSEDKSSWFKM